MTDEHDGLENGDGGPILRCPSCLHLVDFDQAGRLRCERCDVDVLIA